MMDFLIYDGKVAIALLVFYLFYRFLLKKETFHRFNRLVLVGTAVLSFLLPLCIITIYKPMESEGPAIVTEELPRVELASAVSPATPWWTIVLTVLFLAGVVFMLVRVLVSILSIIKIVRTGEEVQEEEGCKVVVTERDIDPFSWMKYIVLSRKDWGSDHASILVHEKAHISLGHSMEILLVDILSSLQWFNPAMWMLRADLQELHEYEADDAVLRSGANIKDYQYLLIRKAVSKSGYSVANSFNHSILKNRITMMSKSKSPLRRGLRVLYLLPLVCLSIGLQARTVYVPQDKDSKKDANVRVVSKDGTDPLFVLRQAWGAQIGEEEIITRAEFEKLDPSRIQSIEVLKDAAAKEKYGEKAAHGVVIITLKKPQELDEIVVIRYGVKKKDEPIPFYLLEPDTMPTFQGGDMNEFSKWLNQRIVAPKECKHSGTMKVGFVVSEDGSVKNVQIMESVCEELDAMMLALVSQSPKWEPAMSNGHPVAQFITIPVVFEMR